MFGLESEEHTHVPQPLVGMVSPIQCLLCATYRIPSLRFCYRCFWNVAINFIIRAMSTGGAYRYKCQMCFLEMRTRAAIYHHCAQKHIPKYYLNLRYPFQEGEIAVITSGDEDRNNKDVDPRNLPLQPGILLPREHQPVDSNTPSGLEWYTPVCDHRARKAGPPLPFASPMTTKGMKTHPALDCRLCPKEGCYMVCGSASMEVALSAVRCAATRFQMQTSINADGPLPFPTPRGYA